MKRVLNPKHRWLVLTLRRYNDGVDAGHFFARKLTLAMLERWADQNKNRNKAYQSGLRDAIDVIRMNPNYGLKMKDEAE